MRLLGKTALITGGGTGIGLQIARQYAHEGAYVYITGRRENKLQEAVASIGENASYIQADVSRKEDMLAAAQGNHVFYSALMLQQVHGADVRKTGDDLHDFEGQCHQKIHPQKNQKEHTISGKCFLSACHLS